MTNINCSKNCIYQQDGKCGYDRVVPQKISFPSSEDSVCAYRIIPRETSEATKKSL